MMTGTLDVATTSSLANSSASEGTSVARPGAGARICAESRRALTVVETTSSSRKTKERVPSLDDISIVDLRRPDTRSIQERAVLRTGVLDGPSPALAHQPRMGRRDPRIGQQQGDRITVFGGRELRAPSDGNGLHALERTPHARRKRPIGLDDGEQERLARGATARFALHGHS